MSNLSAYQEPVRFFFKDENENELAIIETPTPAIRINIGGRVIVKTLKAWHALAVEVQRLQAVVRSTAAPAPADEPRWEIRGDTLQDNDFAHDVVLRLDGDFESDVQKAAFMARVIEKLNARAAPDTAGPILRELVAAARSESSVTQGLRWHTALVAARAWADSAPAVAAPASIPDGWQLVPLEPTEAMLKAAANTPGIKVIDGAAMTHQLRGYPVDKSAWDTGSPLEQAYRAMLAAAQQEPQP